MCWCVELCLSMGTTSISSDKGSLRDVLEFLSLCHKVGFTTQSSLLAQIHTVTHAQKQTLCCHTLTIHTSDPHTHSIPLRNELSTITRFTPHHNIRNVSPTECENLIRRMLAVNPAKRISLTQIKQHRWMQADPEVAAACQTVPCSPPTDSAPGLGGYSEHILGIMQTLGIDRQRTIEVTD